MRRLQAVILKHQVRVCPLNFILKAVFTPFNLNVLERGFYNKVLVVHYILSNYYFGVLLCVFILLYCAFVLSCINFLV